MKHHLAQLRDLRAYSANEPYKPALDWAISVLTQSHAMTAQAGAVAWQERAAGGVESQWFDCSREEYERLKDSPLYETRELFATPPAAVSVEALEGLVAELRNEAGDWSSGDVRAAYNRISDRIERLIKERSNG